MLDNDYYYTIVKPVYKSVPYDEFASYLSDCPNMMKSSLSTAPNLSITVYTDSTLTCRWPNNIVAYYYGDADYTKYYIMDNIDEVRMNNKIAKIAKGISIFPNDPTYCLEQQFNVDTLKKYGYFDEYKILMQERGESYGG